MAENKAHLAPVANLIIEAVNASDRIAELLDANDHEVERRRAAEDRLRRIADAVRAAIARVDRQLATDRYPVKYRAPFGELAQLRHVLDEMEAEQ